jgi:hypothetical protein
MPFKKLLSRGCLGFGGPKVGGVERVSCDPLMNDAEEVRGGPCSMPRCAFATHNSEELEVSGLGAEALTLVTSQDLSTTSRSRRIQLQEAPDHAFIAHMISHHSRPVGTQELSRASVERIQLQEASDHALIAKMIRHHSRPVAAVR